MLYNIFWMDNICINKSIFTEICKLTNKIAIL